MIWAALLLAQATAETAPLARGAVIFSKTCAVAYCHGPEGSAGRAPQLAGQPLERERVFRAVRDGLPNTSMPGWREKLRPPDLEAVVAYVMSLAAASSPRPAPPRPAPSRGRELFFDPARLGSCGTCHLHDGWGVEIGPSIAQAAPQDISGPPKRVKTAQPLGENPFPALVVGETKEEVRLYDLTVPPPVLRTFSPREVKLSAGTTWTHAAVTRIYSDQELEAILTYLRSKAP